MLSFSDFLNEQLLIEAKIDDYKEQEKKISTEHDSNAQFKKAPDIIDHFHSFNPTGNVDHTRWVVNRYKAGELKQEDAPAMKDTLNQFNKYKDKLTKKNIHQYKSLEDLRNALRPHVGTAKSDVKDKAVQEGADLVHDGDKVKLYHVHTMEASRELGKGMPWCTSHRDDEYNMFDHYNEASGGRFYIAHLKGEKAPYRKLGIGVGTGEFQDENNIRMSHEDLTDLVKRNPELKKIPALQGVRVATTQDHDKHFEDLAENDPENVKHVKNLSDDTVQRALNSPNSSIRATALKHAKGKILDDIFNDPGNGRKKAFVLENNPNVEPHHIDRAIDHDDRDVYIPAANHENTSSNQLEKLLLKTKGKETESLMKTIVASHPNASPELLEKLYNDNDKQQASIDNVIASNPKTPHHVISDFIDRNMDRKWEMNAVVHNPNLSSEHIEKIISGATNTDAIQHLIRYNPNITKEHLMMAMDHPYINVKADALRHKLSDNDVAQKGLRDADLNTRIAAAEHPSHTPEQIDKLLDSDDEHIRRAAAYNPSASSDNIMKALKDKKNNVRTNALYRQDLKPEHLNHVLKNSKDDWEKRLAAQHPNIDDKGRAMALNQGHYDPQEIAGFKDSFVTKHLSSTDPEDYKGAAKLAGHITKPEHFNIAVNHPDPAVRAHLVSFNRNTPPDIKEKLKRDPHDIIRQLANTD